MSSFWVSDIVILLENGKYCFLFCDQDVTFHGLVQWSMENEKGGDCLKMHLDHVS